MLSRRSVRIKVIQHLYMIDRDKDLSKKECIESYKRAIDQVFALYLYNLYVLLRVAEMSLQDKKKRTEKYIKKEEDTGFRARLYENPLIQSLATNDYFQKEIGKNGFKDKVNEDIIKRIYKSFARSPIYKDYVYKEGKITDLDALLELYRYCRKDEYFGEMMEDFAYHWLDDKSLIIGAVKKAIKSLPTHGKDLRNQYPDADKINDFGLNLLTKSLDRQEAIGEIIQPVVENWDMDRLALIDLIILKMGTLEFLDFPSIHTNVTIVEYVELAKLYSTERSKKFINGVLDKVLSVLDEEGKIKKVEVRR